MQTQTFKFCLCEEEASEFSVPRIQKPNDVAENFNRAEVEVAKCILIDSKFPKSN